MQARSRLGQWFPMDRRYMESGKRNPTASRGRRCLASLGHGGGLLGWRGPGPGCLTLVVCILGVIYRRRWPIAGRRVAPSRVLGRQGRDGRGIWIEAWASCLGRSGLRVAALRAKRLDQRRFGLWLTGRHVELGLLAGIVVDGRCYSFTRSHCISSHSSGIGVWLYRWTPWVNRTGAPLGAVPFILVGIVNWGNTASLGELSERRAREPAVRSAKLG